MKYRFRMENIFTGKRKTITIVCANPGSVMVAAAAVGWIVQIYYKTD